MKKTNSKKHNEGFEHNEYMLLEFDKALELLSFDNTIEVLIKSK